MAFVEFGGVWFCFVGLILFSLLFVVVFVVLKKPFYINMAETYKLFAIM